MELSCVICLNKMSSTDELLGTTCGHVCHSACMDDWLKRSLTCPQCRCVVGYRDIGRIYLNFTNSEDSVVENIMINHQSELDTFHGLLLLKDQEIQLKDQQMQQKDQQMQQKDQQMQQKDQQMQQRDQQMQQKDQEIHLKTTTIANYQKEVENLHSLLQKKDQQMQQKDQQMQQKDQELQQKTAIIEYHKKELEDLHSLVKLKDQQMQQNDQEIHQKTTTIANYQKELENLHSFLQQKDQQIQKNTAIIANLEDDIKKKDQKDTDQMTLIESLKKQIEIDQRELTSSAEESVKLEESVADFSKKLSDECAKSSYYATQLAMQRQQQERILDLEMRNKWAVDEAIAGLKRELTSSEEKRIKLETSVADFSRKLSVECSKSSETEQKLKTCVREKLELQAQLDCLKKELVLNKKKNVESKNNSVVPIAEKKASESKTKNQGVRPPLRTVNQNCEKSHYNLRPR